jgi:superfamily II DNA or RNA helicase
MSFDLTTLEIENIKDEIIEKSYIGKKGYSIPKNILNDNILYKLKRELTVKPYAPPTSIQRPKEFTIFRESPKKIYVPRFYGIERFGNPSKISIDEGEDIDIKFNGELRDYQENIVNSYIKQAKETGGGLIDVPCGYGKCLAYDTPILMWNGNIEKVQNIKPGDKLLGDDSTIRNVLSINDGKEIMYKITNKHNESYTVNESHILSLMCVKDVYYNNKKYNVGDILDINILEYLKTTYLKQHFKGYKTPVRFKNIYMENTENDSETYNEEGSSIKDYDVNNLVNNKYYFDGFILSEYIDNNDNLYELKYKNYCNINKIIKKIKLENVINQISFIYGILDSKYKLKNDYYEIIFNNKKIVEDLLFICRSIGIDCYIKTIDDCSMLYIYKSISNYKLYFENNILVTTYNYEDYLNNNLLTDIKIENIGIDKYYGFTIDGNHRFLLGDFTVTHNTVMGLNIITKLKKKTLIIVHKEFLMNQWIERIEQYLPDARVGKIQGKKVEVENKDIVLGMLQSLSMKDYNDDLFNQFGFTLIDECFPYNTFVETNKGPYKIGKLYEMWKKNNIELPKILSYNDKQDIFEYNELTYSWKKKTSGLLEIILTNNSIISCTLNHKILTDNGYIKASTLIKGDIILVREKIIKENNKKIPNIITKSMIDNNDKCLYDSIYGINNDMLSIILGSILSGAFEIKKLYGSRYYIINKQIEIYKNGSEPLYVNDDMIIKWKKYMLNLDDNDDNDNDNYFMFDNSNILYIIKDGIMKYTDIFLKYFDIRILSIWILDRGIFKDNNLYIDISNIHKENNDFIINAFLKYNIIPLFIEYNNKLYIRLNKLDTSNIIRNIKPFIRGIINEIPIWSNEFKCYNTINIDSIKYNNINTDVYDIEVEHNHNFLVSNIYDKSQTIVHNCHHIGAEVFSRSLFKIVSKYMMGLSATMTRKDGLTFVFKQFLGDIAYKLERDSSDEHVTVKTIKYYNDDEEFSNVELNWKGQVHYSVMISKICQFNQRSEFIIKVLEYELNLHPEQQIMILAHNKSLLKYIHDAVQHRNIGSVGYYVGGMKEKALKETENKQVVIATYAMAEEALDIKTLSALILATPRSDVTQAVGRILRMKHKNPVVYDIIDQHEFFKVQYFKRQKFYKKCKYRILQTDSDTFMSKDFNENTSWRNIYDPKKNNKIKETAVQSSTKSLLKGKCLLQL